MLKKDIVDHYNNINNWFQSLKIEDEQIWNTPIEKDKWSVGAVIAHILLWDKYSIKERFPNFQSENKLPPFPDFQKINNHARQLIEDGAEKDVVIDELLTVRRELMDILERLNEEHGFFQFFRLIKNMLR